MRYSIIDIGSNSVRLMLNENLITLKKYVTATGLGRGLLLTGNLQEQNIQDTLQTLIEYKRIAYEEFKTDVFYIFATEAVRSAKNKNTFLKRAKNLGFDIDVIENKLEAKLGFYGAYTKGEIGVLDIGGASTELSIGNEESLLYSKSLPIGVARIKDKAPNENPIEINKYILEVIKDYGNVPNCDELLAIGGTATTFAAIYLQLKTYDPKKVDGFIISKNDILEITEGIRNLTMEQRLKVIGLEEKRRDLIVGGGYLLVQIMDMLNLENIKVRESDNLEGYLKYKLGIVK